MLAGSFESVDEWWRAADVDDDDDVDDCRWLRLLLLCRFSRSACDDFE